MTLNTNTDSDFREIDAVVSSFLDHAIVNRGLAQLTIESYSTDLRDLTLFLKSRSVLSPTKVQKEHILLFLELLNRQGLTPELGPESCPALKVFSGF